MRNLKLYVWDKYGCDYTCGVAFALAESAEEARQMIIEEASFADKKRLADKPKIYDTKFSYEVWGGG